MITLQGLGKSYGTKPVLTTIDLEIRPNRLTTFIGPNGAGKSTLLSIISRLLPKDQGFLSIKGQEIEAWTSRALAKELSMLRQQNHFQVSLTVQELVAFGRFPYSQGRMTVEDKEQIEQALAHMELEQFRSRPIDQLSGGQLQRVLIAMVLAQDTDIILLDEPLNNLDLKQSLQMMKTLRRLVDELGKTVIVVLHDINVASQFSDEMVAFKDGRVFCQGTPDEVMQKDLLQQLYEVELTLAEVNGKTICIYQ